MAQLRRFAGNNPRLGETVDTSRSAVQNDIGDAAGGFEVADVAQVPDVAPHRVADVVDAYAKGHRPRRIDGQRHLPGRAASGNGLRDAGHGGEARCDQLLRDIVQRIAVDIATEHVDHHDKRAPVRSVGAADVQRCSFRLFALDRRRDAAQFQFADPDVNAAFEQHLEVAAGAPD